MLKNKYIINLFGSPSSGKSTTASDVFSMLKKKNINVELVREYVKELVWSKHEIRYGEQTQILAEQIRREFILFEDVDVIVTDCPVLLSIVYEDIYESDLPKIAKTMINKHNELVKRNNYIPIYIFLERTKKYNTKGRYQTEEEAIKIDSHIKQMMNNEKLDYVFLPCIDGVENEIFNYILNKHEKGNQ